MWQPIESAPKDGTGFLVYWPASKHHGAEIDRVSGWEEYAEIIGFGQLPATHWHPLPDPPRHSSVNVVPVGTRGEN